MVRCLVLALLVGCSPSLPVYVDQAELPELVDATADAVDFWNSEVGYEALRVQVVPAVDGAWLDPLSIHVRSVDDVSGDNAARSTLVVGRVVVERSALSSVYLDALVAHELGHQLGLGHHGSCDVVDLDEPSSCLDGDAPTPNVMFSGRVALEALLAAHPQPLQTTRAQRRRVRGLLAARFAVPL